MARENPFPKDNWWEDEGRLARLKEAGVEIKAPEDAYATGGMFPGLTQVWSPAAEASLLAQQPSTEPPTQNEQVPAAIFTQQEAAPVGNPIADKLMRALQGKQAENSKYQKENMEALRERIKKLSETPEKKGGLAEAIAKMGDYWGGGGGKFQADLKAQDQDLTPQQRQAAITQLEDTLRKSSGDLTQGEIDMLKMQLNYELGKEKLDATGNKPQKLNATAQAAVGGIASGLRALNQMSASMAKGVGPSMVDPNTPIIGGLQSDTDFTRGQRTVSEVLGRLQSGGAITTDEVKKFNAMGPRVMDSPEQQKAKLNDQKIFLENKLLGFGVSPQNLPAMGFDLGESQPVGVPAQPAGLPWKRYGG